MTADSLAFTASVEFALKGPGAPQASAYDAASAKAGEGLAWLRGQYAKHALELLEIPARRTDIAAAREALVGFTKNTTDVVVLGIGGSSLGGQALADVLPFGQERSPRVTFFDNVDAFTFDSALKHLDLRTTRFVAISKSGGTAEPLTQALAAADAIDRAGGDKYLKDHFIVVTEAKPSALRKFAEDIGSVTLEHPGGVGGRYSVLTMVGLVPALLMGLDVEALRAGAAEALDATLTDRPSTDIPAAAGAALHHALAETGKLNETVLWCYSDRLKTFGPWWRQLWAESLGKDGKGSTPVAALGPVDQHSQLQLFLGGPGKALYTVVTTDTKGEGPTVPKGRAEALGLSYLAGRHMGDLVAAEARATIETLHKNGRPVRQIHVPKIDERAMGALFMHFMLETILMGRLMGVDPFDQPAVEEGKVLARRYLESGG